MSSKKRLFKRDCRESDGCKIFPTFKISSCPLGAPVQGVPPTVFSPVYGLLYMASSALALAASNVDFDTVVLSSGVTLDIVNDSITVNGSGIYTITYSTVGNCGWASSNLSGCSFRSF